MRHKVASGEIDRLHVDVEHAVEIGLGDFVQRSRLVRHTGIVDEDVDLAESHQRRGCKLIDARVLADIDMAGFLAEFARQGFGALEVDVGDQYLRPLGDEFAHYARAEARGTAGDDGCLAA